MIYFIIIYLRKTVDIKHYLIELIRIRTLKMIKLKRSKRININKYMY